MNSDTIKAWPARNVEMRALSTLTKYDKNARTHSPEQVAQIAASIAEFGWTMPVLVDGKGVLIAGHGRVDAAKKLGIKEVPVMVADGWTAMQIKAYRIADNKLALNAGWDDEMLKIELGDLQFNGFTLELTGFNPAELDVLMKEPDFEPGSEDDQGRLDTKAHVTCPECGHEFEP